MYGSHCPSEWFRIPGIHRKSGRACRPRVILHADPLHVSSHKTAKGRSFRLYNVFYSIRFFPFCQQYEKNFFRKSLQNYKASFCTLCTIFLAYNHANDIFSIQIASSHRHFRRFSFKFPFQASNQRIFFIKILLLSICR